MSEITTLQFPPLAYRLKDFCKAAGISLRTFYTLMSDVSAFGTR